MRTRRVCRLAWDRSRSAREWGGAKPRTENCRETTALGLGPDTCDGPQRCVVIGRGEESRWLAPGAAVARVGDGGERRHVDDVAVARCKDGRTVDALAPAAEEGRSHAAKRAGEGLAPGDPAISEWGNPAAVMGRHPPASSGCGGHRGN